MAYRETATGVSRAQHNKQRISTFIAKVSYAIRKKDLNDELDVDFPINLNLIKTLSGRYISYYDYLSIGLDWYSEILDEPVSSSLISEADIRSYILYREFKTAMRRCDFVLAFTKLVDSFSACHYLIPRLIFSKILHKDRFLKYA